MGVTRDAKPPGRRSARGEEIAYGDGRFVEGVEFALEELRRLDPEAHDMLRRHLYAPLAAEGPKP